MGSYLIYDQATGVIKSCIRTWLYDSTIIAMNTPVGCAALQVPDDNPAVTDQGGYIVSNGSVVKKP